MGSEPAAGWLKRKTASANVPSVIQLAPPLRCRLSRAPDRPPYGIRFMGKELDGSDIDRTMRQVTRKDTLRPDGWKRHDGLTFAA